MSFKGFKMKGMYRASLALLTVLTIVGCALNEGPPPEKKKNLKSNLKCLSKIQGQLVDYVDGKLKTPEEIDAMTDCASNALTTFKDRTHGLKKNTFTAKEIRNFLQRYFLEKFTITDTLLLEAMRVKQAIFGGENEEFSTADIDYGIGIIRRIGGVLKVLQPHMPMGMKRFEAMKESELDFVLKDFNKAADLFSGIITEKGITYSFSDCDRFLGEMIKHFPDVQSFKTVREHLDLASTFKAVFISPERSRDELGPEDWKVILEDGARWAGVGLKLMNLNANSTDILRGTARNRLSDVFDETLGLFSRVVMRHSGVIQFSVLNELIDALPWDRKVGNYVVEKKTLKKTLKVIVLRAFSEIDRSESGRGAAGITIGHLKNLDRLVDEILQGAAYAEDVYKSATGNPNFPYSATAPRGALLASDAQIQAIAKRTGGGEMLIQAAKSLRSTYTGLPAFFQGDTSEIIFGPGMDKRARTYRDAFSGVYLKPLFKRILRGYLEEGDIRMRGMECWERSAGDARCVEAGLTQKEFKVFITDFWPILLDFKFVWTTSIIERDSKKRFMEAALFTPVSNGDDYISMDEGLAMVMYMISAKPLGTRLHAAAAKVCKNGPPDESNQPSLEPHCYRRVIFDFSTRNSISKEIWGTMPLFMKYYDSLSASEQADLRLLIEEPIRKEGYVPNLYFDSAATDTMAMMFHYIESLYARFDHDPFNLTISRNEANEAFSVFKKTLAEITKMDEDKKILHDVFTWLLAKGRNPVNPELKGLKKLVKSVPFLWWAAWNPKFEAPRGNLLSIFGQIGKMATPENPQPGPAPQPREEEEEER